jgi:hypothetical protein
MKKIDLINALSSLDDQDEVVLRIDGGDYWGYYVDHPRIEICPQATEHPDFVGSVGHPGGRDGSRIEGRCAIIHS